MTGRPSDRNDVPQRPNEAAAYWDARMRSPQVSPAERDAFADWYQADPAHRRAYDKLQSILYSVRRADDMPEWRALEEDALLSLPGRRRRLSNRLAWFGSAAALALVTVVGLFVVNTLQPPNEPIDTADQRVQNDVSYAPPFFATAIAKTREVMFEDGSSAILNTNSLIRERYSAGERLVELIRGQAEFSVETNAERPFVVLAGDRRITALGTIFDVRLGEEREVQVTQIKGIVEVTPRVRDDAIGSILAVIEPVVRLEPGQQLIALQGRPDEIVMHEEIESEQLWKQGRVFFEDDALRDAIAEMSRYSQTPIRARGLGADDFRIYGTYRTTNVDDFLNAIEAYFPVEIDRSNPGEIVVTNRR